MKPTGWRAFLITLAALILSAHPTQRLSADQGKGASPRSAKPLRAKSTQKTTAETKRGETTGTPIALRQKVQETTKGVEINVGPAAASAIAQELEKADTKTTKPAAALVVTVPLGGELSERGGGLRLLGPRKRSLKETLELFVRLRDDAAVSTVVLELSALGVGTATVQELRQGVDELRRAGKHTVAVLNDDSQSGYLLAVACDQIVMPPSNALMLVGAKVDGYFFRQLLDKLGARAVVVHIGQYKSYGEMFTEDDFTSPARENMRALVDDAYRQLVESIAAGRHMTTATIEALVDRGPLTAREALEARLVDQLAYREEIAEAYRRQGAKVVAADNYGVDKRIKPEEMNLLALFTALSKGATASRESKFPQVAVVYAVGPIVPGSSDNLDLSNADEIAADDYMKILDDIEKDASIKGVILRVNSPGGSAFASDVLFRRIVELGKKKPVIASMGDVAASGGYYLAMAASKIIADPMTVTGSIGVVGGKIDLAGTYDKLGIHKTTIARGRFANLFSETGGFSPAERAVIEKLMRQTYDEFVAKAARQRAMTTAALESLAQGKVYTGAQARAVGLVDELGGFSRAVLEMKHQLGLQPEDKVALVAYPKELTLLDVLQKAMGMNAQLAELGATAGVAHAPQSAPPPLERGTAGIVPGNFAALRLARHGLTAFTGHDQGIPVNLVPIALELGKGTGVLASLHGLAQPMRLALSFANIIHAEKIACLMPFVLNVE
ncbi:MAG: signal peptide peptidase SppA [Candidatus Sumerlaeaceae bacterium]